MPETFLKADSGSNRQKTNKSTEMFQFFGQVFRSRFFYCSTSIRIFLPILGSLLYRAQMTTSRLTRTPEQEPIFLVASNLDWGYISLWKCYHVPKLWNESRKKKENWSIKWTYIRVCHVRREQMLKLKIYRAKSCGKIYETDVKLRTSGWNDRMFAFVRSHHLLSSCSSCWTCFIGGP